MRGKILRILALVALVTLASLLSGCDLLAGGTPAPDADGSVKVTLTWDDPVDLDLEIWDEDGRTFMASAGWYGTDVTEGPGQEVFEFEQQDEHDFSRGVYTVSVFYADDDEAVDVPVELTVEDPDGDKVTREGTAFSDVEQAQWHAFTVNAATGDIEVVDEHIGARSAEGSR